MAYSDSKPATNTAGWVLFSARTKRDLTKAAFARILGLSRTTYGYYENNQRPIPVAVAQKIAEIINVDTSLLTARSGSAYKIDFRWPYQGRISRDWQKISEIEPPVAPPAIPDDRVFLCLQGDGANSVILVCVEADYFEKQGQGLHNLGEIYEEGREGTNDDFRLHLIERPKPDSSPRGRRLGYVVAKLVR